MSGMASSSDVIASSGYRPSTSGLANMELFHVEPELIVTLYDMSSEDLCSFAELYEDPVNNVQIELYVLAYFLLFTKTLSTEHVEQAIQRTEGWVAVTELDDPERARRFQILDMMSARMYELAYISQELLQNYERYGSIEDLDKAISVIEQVLNITPQGSEDLAAMLSNFGAMLSRRFERTGSMDDLNQAVDVANMAVEATPQDHPKRAGRLSNLGNRFGSRFEQTGSMDDLNRAVDVGNMAVEATPQDHPNRAIRFERTGSMDDLNRALSYHKDGWACYTSPPSTRIVSARRSANILTSQLRWEEASDFLQGAVKLLPIVSPRLLGNNDKQHMLGQFSGLASMAAAIWLKAGKDEHLALELLELGRCVIAGLLLEMRTDISDLKQQYPMLAAEFETLRNKLDSPPSETTLLGDTASPWKVQANQRLEADKRLKELITEIRGQPDFQNFLLPPTHEELMAAASQGPIVIINVSSYRCDAFLITHYQVKVLALPNLKEVELNKRIQQHSVGSTSTLQWLWNVAAGPILDALGYQHLPLDNNWPQVWWIPTGALSHFPIHAAGFHTKGSTKTVLDRVMSSYTSSVKALIYGRRHSVQKPTGPGLEQALLVAMRDTPSLSRNSVLPFAAREVDIVAGLCPSLQLKPVTPSKRREEVLAHLRACKIFHFAGHGRSDPLDPSRSCLLLDDWTKTPLTVGDLRDSNIQESSPFLGYLSACSTSANKVDRLVDEGIHLASAFQLAGFRHVIGTLWEVSDSHCVDAARVVYETIQNKGMTDVAVRQGLHRAVKGLRDGHVEWTREARDAELSDEELCDEGCESPLQSPLYWAPYIHFGV
ncbi:uncharacterized protein BDZ99DRAFT_544163 [Mytilinidion resinicola]|uniref:CHAT domain-containing protein n=1 Tax=Mytilinidion resinicola TaxID=574789 RepID=A0A6A6Y6R1_9PEZI|nr:uncharacterized protein BDZ99DRAFT_544163 [Mytilinidion resinicola]KAF2804516.1 hypothetical protein BDZ99DRAFT_544163 [Mytilinidion resinicola]